jgi:hypothetical protein
MARRLLALLALAGLGGCQSMMTYRPSDRFDNQVVRGEVTYVATPEVMAATWEKTVKQLPDAPPKDEFVRDYLRVAVLIEKFIGGSYLVHPYIPVVSKVSIGDVVEVPLYVGGPRVGYFSGRPQVSRVVCLHTDDACLASTTGRTRGAIGPVFPRD